MSVVLDNEPLSAVDAEPWTERAWQAALTAGLAGFGRADPKVGWGATVFLQVLDPAAFAGTQAFVRQTDKLVETLHRDGRRNVTTICEHTRARPGTIWSARASSNFTISGVG